MIYPTVKITIIKLVFNSLWIKYVTGFNPKYHCQKCLKGFLTKKFKYIKDPIFLNKEIPIYLNEYRTPFIYICGVTNNYADNLHLPFRPAQNQEFEFKTDSIHIKVYNGTKLDIKQFDLPFPPDFSSCRNFQFGYQYFKMQQNGIL
jgi:hypothetical protein